MSKMSKNKYDNTSLAMLVELASRQTKLPQAWADACNSAYGFPRCQREIVPGLNAYLRHSHAAYLEHERNTKQQAAKKNSRCDCTDVHDVKCLACLADTLPGTYCSRVPNTKGCAGKKAVSPPRPSNNSRDKAIAQRKIGQTFAKHGITRKKPVSAPAAAAVVDTTYLDQFSQDSSNSNSSNSDSDDSVSYDSFESVSDEERHPEYYARQRQRQAETGSETESGSGSSPSNSDSE